jgi:Rrf2 family protein
MKLTRATIYALHALVQLAEQGDAPPLASHAAARSRGLPERFLLKVLKPLVDVGVLHSVKGPGGGYRLLKPANKVTLLEIVEAVDGPLIASVPRNESAEGKRLDQKLEVVAQRVTDELRKQLRAITLAELVRGTSGKKS